MWKIKQSLLLDASDSAKRYYPDEFMCFIGGNAKSEIADEIVLLPTYNDTTSASILESVIPIDASIIGTLHSHPDSSARPSDADKKFFMKHKLNIILGSPFSIQSAAFYDEKGKRITVTITP